MVAFETFAGYVLMLSSAAFGDEAHESLLELMKSERNDVLEEISNDFMEIGSRLLPPIDLVCVYEVVPTDISKYAGKVLPGVLQQAFKASARAVANLTDAQFAKSPVCKILSRMRSILIA